MCISLIATSYNNINNMLRLLTTNPGHGGVFTAGLKIV